MQTRFLIVVFFIIIFFSVDSSTRSAEDGQQGSSNVWSTYCERNQVGGREYEHKSSCARVPASYFVHHFLVLLLGSFNSFLTAPLLVGPLELVPAFP